MIDGKVCEHCLLGMVLFSLMGRFRVYECEKVEEYEYKDLLTRFYNICEGYHCGVDYKDEKRERRWKPKYKRIPSSEMRKSESCIRQEKEDAEDRKKKADRLRKDAMELMCEAQELERNQVPNLWCSVRHVDGSNNGIR